jgi:hypothetical protein
VTGAAWKKPLALFLLVVLVYLANGRTLASGDTIPARYLPLSLLREFDFDLDEFTFLAEEVIPYYLQYQHGHLISTFPPGPPLLAIPVYFFPAVAGISPYSAWLPFLEKLSATLMAALSVLLLYFTLQRLTSERIALLIAIIYALGTSTFSVSSQALWQHGPAQLLLTATILLLVLGLRQRRFVGVAGLPLMGMVVCRPPDALIALPILVYVGRHHFRESLRFIFFSLPPILLLLGYNYYYFGSLSATGYGPSLADPTSFWWKSSLVDGLLWVLVSPHRGLFIYSPILLLSIVGIVVLWRHRNSLLRYISLAPLLVILFYAKLNWWGGWSYGPRYMADIAPLLSLCLSPVLEMARRRAFLKWVIAPLVLVSVAMHSIGAFGYDSSWEVTLVDRADVDRFWSWADAPFMHYGERVLLGAMQRLSGAQSVALRGSDEGREPTPLEGAHPVPGLPQRDASTIGSHCPLDVLLEQNFRPRDKSPVVRVATDKRTYHLGEVSTVMIGVQNDEVPQTFVSYIALERPNGTVSFLGLSGVTTGDLCDLAWMRWGGSYSLWKGHRLEEYPILGLRTDHLPPGMYAWHFFFTEPRTTRVVSRAKTVFMVQP